VRILNSTRCCEFHLPKGKIQLKQPTPLFALQMGRLFKARNKSEDLPLQMYQKLSGEKA